MVSNIIHQCSCSDSPRGSPHLLNAHARPELALDLLVVQSPLPLHKFVVVAAGEKADGDLKASRFAPAAAVIAPCLRPAERLLQKGVRVERRLLRAQTPDNHFTPALDDQSVNNRRVNVLLRLGREQLAEPLAAW